MPEPELFVPASERADAPSPLARFLARLWLGLGVLVIGPIAYGALVGPEREVMKSLLVFLVIVWLAVAWIVGPLLSPKPKQR